MPRTPSHQELREIEEMVIQIGLTGGELHRRFAMQAVCADDTLLVDDQCADDRMMNELQREHTQPMYQRHGTPGAGRDGDLRSCTTVQLVINELERMGDRFRRHRAPGHRIPVIEPLLPGRPVRHGQTGAGAGTRRHSGRLWT